MDLYCLIWGEKVSAKDIFVIKAETTNTVANLEALAQNARAEVLRGAPVVFLKVHPLIPFDADFNQRIQNFNLQDQTEQLEPWLHLSHVFANPPPGDHLHLIVKRTTIAISAGLAGFKRPYASETSQTNDLKRIKLSYQEREVTINLAIKAPSPSSGCEIGKYITEQKVRPIFNGRPGEYTGISICLYHEVFTKFQAALASGDITPTAEDYAATERLFEVATACYDDGKARNELFLPALSAAIHDTCIKVSTSSGAKSDAVLVTQCSDMSLAYRAVIETNNEIGNGRGDPSIRGILSYRNYWVQPEAANVLASCCCPSFIIAAAGPWICILGAVFVNQVIAQPLTGYIRLGRDPQSNSGLRAVAKVFRALSDGLKSLHRFYYDLSIEEHSTKPIHIFPYVQSYRHGQGSVEFRYICKLAPSSPENAIFKAQINDPDGKLVVVKFVQTYNAVAHHLLASQKLAPPLLFPLDDTQIYKVGELQMVVMEFVEGQTAFESGFVRLPEYTFQGVQKAISILHEQDWVFGDLRTPNIVISSDGPMLIDFDWCAKAGVGRYPPSLNDSTEIGWHADVKRDGLMQKGHDIFMLEGLRPKPAVAVTV